MGAASSVANGTSVAYSDEDLAKIRQDFDAFLAAAPRNAEGKVEHSTLLGFMQATEGKKKSLHFEGDVATTMTRRRRNSVLAVETDDKLDKAASDQKAQILLDTIKKDLSAPEGGEFASYALSSCTELAMGSPENRKIFIDGGCCEIIQTYLTMYPDDVFVQYQGMFAAGNLAESKEAADKFGTAVMVLIVKALCNTDAPELAVAGIRALAQLVNNSETCKTFNTADLVKTLTDLMEEFKGLNQFLYRTNELIRTLDESSALSPQDLGAQSAKRLKAPENLGVEMSRRRRNSVMAVETDTAVSLALAAGENQAQVLMDAITKDLANPEKGGDFASYALSSITAMSMGSEDNRKVFVDGGCCTAVTTYLSSNADDFLVQYQGIIAISTLAVSEETADKFGTDTMLLIVKALCETDGAELAVACCKALRALTTNSKTCKGFETADLIQTVEGLKEDFGWLNQFQYTAGELLSSLRA
jgi:predicted phosphoribosyltransferase